MSLSVGAAAQDNAAEVIAVTGIVNRMSGDRLVPAPGVRVVAHRVDSAASGAQDSVLTAADGRFRIPVRAFGTDSSVYFLSVVYSGIAYFSQFWHRHDLSGALGDIVVFDTTSAPVPVSSLSRQIVLFAPRPGQDRRVLEVHVVANDSSVTRVTRDARGEVWSAPVPREAYDFIIPPFPSTLAEGQLRMEDGRVKMTAPFAPGLRQISYTYALPGGAFPLDFRVEAATDTLEVLLEEEGASTTGGGLAEANVVGLGGTMFRRFMTTGVTPGTVLSLTVPRAGAPGNLTYALLLVLTLSVGMLIALAATFRRRAPRASPGAARTNIAEADALAMQIAELDRTFQDSGEQGAVERERYHAEREQLKKQLALLLARRKR